MKSLLVAFLCVAAVSAYTDTEEVSLYDSDKPNKSVAELLRDHFLSNEGIAALRKSAREATTTTEDFKIYNFAIGTFEIQWPLSPITTFMPGFLVTAFVRVYGNYYIKQFVTELFSGIEFVGTATTDDIRELLNIASTWLQTDEGLKAVRHYATVPSFIPVANQIKDHFAAASDAELRDMIKDIFNVL